MPSGSTEIATRAQCNGPASHCLHPWKSRQTVTSLAFDFKFACSTSRSHVRSRQHNLVVYLAQAYASLFGLAPELSSITAVNSISPPNPDFNIQLSHLVTSPLLKPRPCHSTDSVCAWRSRLYDDNHLHLPSEASYDDYHLKRCQEAQRNWSEQPIMLSTESEQLLRLTLKLQLVSLRIGRR